MPLSARVRALLAAPPKGSKTREALEFGVDLSMTTRRLSMSVDERLADLGAKMDWLKSIRAAGRARLQDEE